MGISPRHQSFCLFFADSSSSLPEKCCSIVGKTPGKQTVLGPAGYGCRRCLCSLTGPINSCKDRVRFFKGPPGRFLACLHHSANSATEDTFLPPGRTELHDATPRDIFVTHHMFAVTALMRWAGKVYGITAQLRFPERGLMQPCRVSEGQEKATNINHVRKNLGLYNLLMTQTLSVGNERRKKRMLQSRKQPRRVCNRWSRERRLQHVKE